MNDARVLVDATTRDDAAVVRISDHMALVATVDFFTPIVDDAYDFGRIAAANAFSDLYAMGAEPLLALNLVAWPRAPEMLALLGETLRGGADVAREAGALVLGGHSIDDAEPKYGMVALGQMRADKVITNAGARTGDQLVLTKPIGTGILATALKRDLIGEKEMSEAVTSMTTLNSGAMAAMRSVGDAVHACTDVTGFGLLGHLHGMLEASGVAADVHVGHVPLLARARDLAAQGAVPGGTTRNVEAAGQFAIWGEGVSETDRIMLCDAQTSGGLLISIAAERVDELVSALKRENTPAAAVIGEIVDGPAGRVEVSAGDA